MDEGKRREFLLRLSKTAGAILSGKQDILSVFKEEEIIQLAPEQREFMLIYEKWMDQMSELLKLQKAEPDNMEYRKRMMELSEMATEWQETLQTYMKDRKFALIYHACIARLKPEIE